MHVLKHTPWMGAFPLSPFENKLYELKSTEKERSILLKVILRLAFNTVMVSFTWITFIIYRIDEDMFNYLEFHKKLQLVSSGVPVSVDELPPHGAHFMNIDINSLIIFLDILMDDISRFMKYLFIEPHFLNFGSFEQLKNELNNCGGERIEELNTIFQRTDWYQELNTLRNKPVVHMGEKFSSVGKSGDAVGIYLLYLSKEKIVEKFMSNLEIDELCDNVHSFLTELNNFLCKNFDYLPMEARKK